MDRNQPKSNMKRTCGDNEGQRNKIQRIKLSDDSSRDNTTKITDTNDDCLMKIFGHLDLQSLFNVAVANEWLRPAANDVYKRRFGTSVVYICECDDYHPRTRAYNRGQRVEYDYRTLNIHYAFVQVRGLKTTLLYLRCFGSSIKELEIAYNHSQSKRYGYVHQYINDYCAGSLVRLSFDKISCIPIGQFQMNFMNVDEIRFSKSQLNEQWSSFFKRFPNLRRLHFTQDKNPMNTLMDLIKDNKSISDLAIRGPSVDPGGLLRFNVHRKIPSIKFDSSMIDRFVSEHPSLIRLDLCGYSLTSNDFHALIRQLHSLEQFQYCGST